MSTVEVTTRDATTPTGPQRPGRLILVGPADGGDGKLTRVQRRELLAGLIPEGLLREYGANILAVGADQLFIPINPSTPGTVSSVTQTGSGPLITVSGDPLGAFSIKVKITKSADQSTGLARFVVTTNGVTYSTTAQPISPETAATVVGTLDLNGAGVLAAVDGKNFELETEDGNPVLYTMGLETSIANLRTSLNTAIGVDSSNAIVNSTLRQGKYLVIQSGTTGAASEITIDNSTGEGDAMALLGLDGQFGQGTTSTLGELIGTVDMTTLDYATLNTKVFTCCTEDGNGVNYTIGVVADFAALVAALNVGIAADGSNAMVSATLRDGKYMVVQTGSTGADKVITSNEFGGMGLLGIANQVVAGADSTYLIPGTGVLVKFPAGLYSVNTLYEIETTAPRMDLTVVQNAIGAVPRDDGTVFDAIAIVEEDWADIYEMRAWYDAIAAILAGWRQGEPYRPIFLVMGAPKDVSDATLQSQFSSIDDQYGVIAARACWASGADLYGDHRRSSLLPLLMQMVKLDQSQSIGEREAGAINVRLDGPDGTTEVINSTAAVDMSDRFNVLMRFEGGTYFVTGRTLAKPGTQPGFNEFAFMRPFNQVCQIIHNTVARKLEATPPLNPDGTLKAEQANALDLAMQTSADLYWKGDKNGVRDRLSSLVAKYDRTNPFGSAKKYVVNVSSQHLGIAHSATVEVAMVSEQE